MTDPQPGYPRPAYGTPPAFGAPAPQPGFAAPYVVPPAPGFAAQPPPRASRTLGAIAFALSIVAVLVAPIVAAVAGWRIGLGVGYEGLIAFSDDPTGSLSSLTPVRGDVLMAETAFWVGTVVGVWAIVQGIVATALGRGRVFGVIAIVLAAIGPFLYFFLLLVLLGAGSAGSIPPNA